MAKPSRTLADMLRALPQAATSRPAALLHLTLLPLGDRAGVDRRSVERIGAVLNTVALPPFRLVFDRLHDSGRTIALRPSEPLHGALAFQRALAAAFERHGLRVTPRYIFRPHITLAYRGGTPGEIAIDPISWLVEDIRLIESIVGETRHVEHCRWALRPISEAARLASARGGGALRP